MLTTLKESVIGIGSQMGNITPMLATLIDQSTEIKTQHEESRTQYGELRTQNEEPKNQYGELRLQNEGPIAQNEKLRTQTGELKT
jgi:hypothetical protein